MKDFFVSKTYNLLKTCFIGVCFFLVYMDAGTANTAATLKFTIATALDNTWRVCNKHLPYEIDDICILHKMSQFGLL